MIHPPYCSRIVFRSLPSCLLAITLTLLVSVAPALELPIDAGIHRDIDPALGISDDFGRWNKTISLVYDPDGAPSAYSDNSKVLALLQQAYSYWTLVSGVRFEIVGIDAGAPDDRDLGASQRDGLVRVSWESIGTTAGQAGPTGGFFEQDLGYFPYDDGSIELNRDAGVIGSDFELVGVLVHEIGHLLGLGHSDNPDSVMYANPYNHLRYPREDDIRAVQVLYGAPQQALDPAQPVTSWLYDPPVQASAAATQFLFKANSHPASGTGAYFEVADTTVTAITSATADDDFLWFVGAIGGGAVAVDVAAKFVVVDPTGYLYDERELTLSCSANSACVRFVTLGAIASLKTLPGTWTVHVVDTATNSTLFTAHIPVSGAPAFNRPPVASISAVPGSGSAQARFTVTASDPDGDAIEVVWHPPGLIGANADVRHRFASGGSASLDVDFAQTGTHSFFVEVRDDATRYGDGPNSSVAGEGFQTLLRVSVNLPAASVEAVTTHDSGDSSIDTPTQQMLAAIATTPMTEQLRARDTVTAHDVLTSAVGFNLGASSTRGTSVATNFTAGDAVIIAGSVMPQTSDIGNVAHIYIVVRSAVPGSPERWTYLNTEGDFVEWNTKIPDLRPAYLVGSLQPSEAFEIFSGELVPATHKIYIGYRLQGGTTLYYTGQAHTLNVGE